ncbi:MAG: hypothetical protein IJC73_08415 [Lentisphaeria bacterium]|nr:hypothetical protein [Lentisphaeria bacterium]
MENIKPSDFYRKIHPELFSDSTIAQECKLTEELLTFEIERISTNQKENQFQVLCRKIAELQIAPNLIPEVGPAGGGDGKTDAETYPIDQRLLARFFIPENGWDNDEKWAFAISAKKDWRSKLKSDVESIVSTGREYTHVFFMTNQAISSKQKRKAEDSIKTQFSIGVSILDQKWLIEKIFAYNYIEIVVKTLGMSKEYLPKRIDGPRDIARQKEFDSIQRKILKGTAYSVLDYQLFEDRLSLAILAQQLERPRQEVEDLFENAILLASARQDITQLRRSYEQLAWAHFMRYDDFDSFVQDYKKFSQYNELIENCSELELAFTMFFFLWKLHHSSDPSVQQIDVMQEKTNFEKILQKYKGDESRPNLALFSQVILLLFPILDGARQRLNCSNYFAELSGILLKTKGLIDFPFATIAKIIKEVLSQIFYEDDEFDKLIDVVAEEESFRKQQIVSGKTYFDRAIVKVEHQKIQDAIVYFGRALMKFSDNEHKSEFIRCLLFLGFAYRDVGMFWASNNALVFACRLAFFQWQHRKGNWAAKIMLSALSEILRNELIIGRVTVFLSWREFTLWLFNQEGNQSFNEFMPVDTIGELDTFLAARLLHSEVADKESWAYLPAIFKRSENVICEDISLFILGYEDIVAKNNPSITKESIIDTIKSLAEQPLGGNFFNKISFYSNTHETLCSSVLGVKISVRFEVESFNNWIAETVLAFLENIFSTSLGKIFLSTSEINIELCSLVDNEKPSYVELERYSYQVHCLNASIDINSLLKILMQIFSSIIIKHGCSKSIIEYINNLFEQEDAKERLSTVANHYESMQYFWGKSQKIKFSQWCDPNDKLMPYIRQEQLIFETPDLSDQTENTIKTDNFFENISHRDFSVAGLIEPELWNKALWKATCFLEVPGQFIVLGIVFDDINYGYKTFEDLRRKVGLFDEKNKIRVSIIKGINSAEPLHYRVVIGENLPKEENARLTIFISRLNEMHPVSSENLDNFATNVSKYKGFYLAPIDAKNIMNDRNFMNYAIYMTEINIRNAWEIGKNDVDCIAIKSDDQPIIPVAEKNPPVNTIIKSEN